MAEDLNQLKVRALPFQVLDHPDGVLLRRGNKKLSFNGEQALHKILLILSLSSAQPIALAELCQKLNGDPQPDELVRTLLQAKFLVREEEYPDQAPDNFEIYLQENRNTKDQFQKRLDARALLLVGDNRLNRAIFAKLRSLGIANIKVWDDPTLRSSKGSEINMSSDIATEYLAASYDTSKTDLSELTSKHHTVICSSDFGGQALLLSWNEWCAMNSIHFYPVWLESMIGYAGPLAIPSETACLNCLRQRQNAHLRNLELKELLETNSQVAEGVLSIHPLALDMLAATAVFELTQFYGGSPNPRPDHVAKLDLSSCSLESKKVLKIPRCPICSKIQKTAETQVNRMSSMPQS